MTASAEYLLRKLRAFGELSSDCESAITKLGADRLRTLKAREDIIREGDDPNEVYLIVEGWACRYKTLEDGRRQIMSYFVPGDLCDLYVYILREMDHSIAAITPLKYGRIAARELDALGNEHPRVLRALWWETLVSASIQREWTVNLGQRDAFEALAHLCCELFLRLRLVGLVEDDSCDFPLTQADMADALGLTTTHLGRVLRKLNDSGLATIRRRTLTVHNLKKLQMTACFNPNYLHHHDVKG